MREILFRGKIVNNEWVYGSLWIDNQGKSFEIGNDIKTENITVYRITPYDYANAFSAEVKKETIGQFTGLLDKNGAKIFEGDIIKGTVVSAWTKCEIVCEVQFALGRFACVQHRWTAEDAPVGTIYKVLFGKDCEVVGNIFDNNDLLKGGAK